MASAINEIYDAIAAWDVSWDSDVTIKVKELQSMDDKIGTPEGAVRILSPLDPETGGGGGHVALGKTMTVSWRISDTLYIRPTSHGRSLENSVPQLMNYIKTYLTAIQNDRSPTNQSWIEEVEWDVGTYAYPTEQNDRYYGVRFLLTVNEVI